MRRHVLLLMPLLLAVPLPILAQGTEIPAHPSDLTFQPLAFEPPRAAEHRHTLPDGGAVFIVEDHALPLVDVPVMVQQAPQIQGYSGTGLETADLAEIADCAPNVRYFKIEGPGAAARIAALPQGAVRDLKRVLNRAGSLDVEGALALETEATVRCFLDPETAERVKSFGGGKD